MQEWLEVDLDAYHEEKTQVVRDEGGDLLVSPYDVPEAVRGYYDKAKRRFVVEFKYIGNEPKESRAAGENLTLQIGVSSRRLYALEVDIDSIKARTIETLLGALIKQEVDGALEELLREPISELREDNYRLAKEAVTSKREELFSEPVD